MGILDAVHIWNRFGAPHAGQIRDLNGKTFVITGATSGIGFHTALQLATQSATVVLANRSPIKTEEALSRLREAHQDGKWCTVQLDLSDLKSCVAAAREVASLCTNGIDGLINNAGVMMCPFSTSAQGIEMQFATNHLGHFVFTNLLLPHMNPKGRIVNVSSVAHETSNSEGIRDIDKLTDEKTYFPISAYGQSKLANVLFARELSRRSRASGRDLYINSCHPGHVRSDLVRHVESGILFKIVLPLIGMVRIGPEPGAGSYTQLFLATAPEIENENIHGQYFVPFGKMSNGSAQSQDQKLMTKLWNMSIDLTEKHLGSEIKDEIEKNVAAS